MNKSDPRNVHPSTCLRVHSEFSEDGSATIRQLAECAAELGYTALAVTDVSVMTGAFDLQREARRVGIKPIFGLDLPIWTVDPRSDAREPEIRGDVITLLAEDNVGLKRLFSLSSEAASLPAGTALTLPRLAASFRGLTAIAAGNDSQLSRLLRVGDSSKAGSYLDILSRALGAERLYVGIPTPDSLDRETARELAQLSKTRSLKIVSGHTVRFSRPQDLEAHQTFLKYKGSPTPPAHSGSYMLDSSGASQAFSDWPEVFTAAEKIVERCRAEFPLGSNLLPTFPTETDETDSQMLRRLVEKGLEERYGDPVPAEAKERMELELRAIEESEFASYFLIVWDFVGYAKENGIVVGPGRGSAASSIVCYALGITGLDPIEQELIFERFLRPDRKKMPDIDVDVSVRGRDQIVLYLIDKYGSESVAQIATSSRFGAREAIRVAAGSHGYDTDLGDTLAEMVPLPIMGHSPSFAVCLTEGGALHEAVDNNPDAARIVDLARGLEGKVRHTSVHAAAFVISERNVEEHVPRRVVVSADPPGQPVRQSVTRLVTQFPMRQVEELGLLKLDLLCLRNLDLIGDTVDLVERYRDLEPKIDEVPLDDEATFELIARGDLTGVFQFESSDMLEATRLVQPTELDDLTALLSLCRPGAQAFIPTYAQGKAEPDSVEYRDPRLREIFGSTYGCFVYQEQVMTMCEKMAGFSLSEANEFRILIGRRQRNARFRELNTSFLEGLAATRTDQAVIEFLGSEVWEAAGYTFNKSHAACYALIAYRTAYLKANYPAEFKEAQGLL